jgi:uncharacterized YkwD family protein
LIKKPISLFLAISLVFGLAACGTNDDIDQTADNRDTLDVRHDNRGNDEFTNRRTVQNNEDNISSLKTQLNSNNYPQTKAILTEDAKYEYVQVDPGQWGNWANRFSFNGQNEQEGNEQQSPNVTQPQTRQDEPAQQPGQNGQESTQEQQTPQNGKNEQPPAPNEGTAQEAPAEQAPTEQEQDTAQQAPAEQQEAGDTAGISQFAQQVIDLTNKERANNGLPALKADAELSSVAEKKSQDMEQNDYFSHTSPTYGSPFDMMRDFGVDYSTAGENIAQGQQTPEEVVDAWMNSPGHRANILSEKFTHIGVGFEEAGNHWTQMFIGK